MKLAAHFAYELSGHFERVSAGESPWLDPESPSEPPAASAAAAAVAEARLCQALMTRIGNPNRGLP